GPEESPAGGGHRLWPPAADDYRELPGTERDRLPPGPAGRLCAKGRTLLPAHGPEGPHRRRLPSAAGLRPPDGDPEQQAAVSGGPAGLSAAGPFSCPPPVHHGD